VNTQEKKPADVLLLIAPGCPHCPGVQEALGNLVKEGVVGTLEVVNVAIHPERATAVGTRTVPWVRIGSFELDGALTLDELRLWAERASEDSGIGAYLSHLLENQRLPKALALIQATPSILDDLVALLEQEDTPLVVRIGVGAIMEELEGSDLLNRVFEQLERLTHSPEPYLRADACHYLALSANPDAAPIFRRLLQDQDPEVREIARESLETLEADSSLH
jgi:thiol-disulfide isomerase/thioredoxin